MGSGPKGSSKSASRGRNASADHDLDLATTRRQTLAQTMGYPRWQRAGPSTKTEPRAPIIIKHKKI